MREFLREFLIKIVDGLVSHYQPQILEEVAEVVKAVKNVPQGGEGSQKCPSGAFF